MDAVTKPDEGSNLVARIEEYGIDPDSAEGLRERLIPRRVFLHTTAGEGETHVRGEDGQWTRL